MKEGMKPSKGHYYFRGDKQIWIISFILVLISVVEVYSTTYALAYSEYGGDTMKVLGKHILFLSVGAFAMFTFQMIPIGTLAKLSGLMLFVMFFVLLFTLIFGVEINHARRWIDIMGFTVQPSEFVKIPLILYVAYILAEKRKQLESLSYIVVYLFAVVVLICVVIVPASLTMGVFLFSVCFIMMCFGRIPRRYLLGFPSVLLLSFVVFLWLVPKIDNLPTKLTKRVTTWRSRIENFVSSDKEVLTEKERDAQAQSKSAQIAIANGLLWGKGPGNGTQMMTLPVGYADFIFASLVEEGGLITAIMVMFLYLWLLYRIYVIMRESRRPYYLYLCGGFGVLIGLQAFAHICITVGLMPVTGLTLPLVSLGGSSSVVTCIELGIIQSVARQQRKELYEGEKQDVV